MSEKYRLDSTLTDCIVSIISPKGGVDEESHQDNGSYYFSLHHDNPYYNEVGKYDLDAPYDKKGHEFVRYLRIRPQTASKQMRVEFHFYQEDSDLSQSGKVVWTAGTPEPTYSITIQNKRSLLIITKTINAAGEVSFSSNAISGLDFIDHLEERKKPLKDRYKSLKYKYKVLMMQFRSKSFEDTEFPVDDIAFLQAIMDEYVVST